ncbi:MAG: relaxase/mobilization nuclease domain-containing protein [Clostridia bacterium]|nr:relaxase/mobilization nuclease domain-containing protein [Clostridia bacterium]
MAIVKFINFKPKRGLKSLRQALDYVDDKNKTMGNHRLVGGIARNSNDAFLRMNVTKKLWHKTDGRQYIHFVISPKGEVSDEKMLNVSNDVQDYFKAFGSFYGIHKNTENTHIHFILNSVGWDGKKYSQSKSDMKKFKNFVSNLCEKYEIKIGKAEEMFEWVDFLDDSEDYFKNIAQPVSTYRPHINDAYKPVCYRLGVDGNYYPVNPVNPDGTVNMIQVINSTTDKVPMIYRVDDNGYLTPELE